MKHIPVMLEEVLQYLAPKNGETYVDATFGDGGYSEAILNAADCKVIAIDRDPTVAARAKEFKEKYGKNFVFKPGMFGDFEELIKQQIDGAVFDIGVSSMQLDEAARGFSFSKDAPLDMRMSCKGLSAADVVNNLSEQKLADILFEYSEEKKSRQIAAKIVEYRKTRRIETTKDLAEIIYTVIHKKHDEIDPATRAFQALRIFINDEIDELFCGLRGATKLLKSGGRLVVVDFHSLEDRVVKHYFNEMAGKVDGVSRYAPVVPDKKEVVFSQISKAIPPSEEECGRNPRARSAKLRWAVKI